MWKPWRSPIKRSPGLEPDWHEVYLDELSRSEKFLGRVSDAIFTVWSFVAHVIVYFLLWVVIDWQPFLNAISVEAVIVSLCVGVNTKLQLKGDRVAQEQRDWMQKQTDRAVLDDKKITEAVHELTAAIHRAVVDPGENSGQK